MHIEKLMLQLYCQHVNKVFEFSPGMNVIVGPIGSGKSNILKAIRFVFTNDSGNPGVREDDVSFSAAPGERSGVHLTGYHNGKGFMLRRMLRPASRELQWDGEVQLRSEKAISEELQNRLGIDPDLFDDFIIVPQGHLSSIVDMKDSVRMEAMHKLVGLQKFAKIYSWMGPYISSLSAPVTVIDLAAAKAKLEGLRQQKEKLEADLAVARSNALPESDVQWAELVQNNKSLFDSLSATARTLELEIPVVREQVQSQETLLGILENNLQSRAELLQKLEADLKQVGEALQQFKLYANRKLLEDELATLEKEPEKPASTPSGQYIPPHVDMVQSERQRLAVIKHVIHSKTCNASVCPSCMRPWDSAVADFVSEKPVLEATIASHDTVVKESREYDIRWANHLALAAARDARLPVLQKALAETSPVPQPTETKEALLNKHIQLTKSLSEEKAAHQTVSQRRITTLQGLSADKEKLASLETQLAETTGKLSKQSGVNSSDYVKAQSILETARSVGLRIASLEGSLRIVNEQIPVEEQNCIKAEKDQVDYSLSLEFRKIVNDTREVFHRSNLPNDLAKSGMIALAAQMNKSLSAFNASFRVQSDGGASFKAAFFTDGIKGCQTDSRLSGGERAKFGLALRVAVHSLWAQGLGFLALDEPTYGFGQNDMSCVKIAIEQLREMSKSQGLQVIVVTHEKSLLNLFDNVIQVGV